MLVDIRSKMPLESALSAPFEVQTFDERENARQQIMMMHMKPYEVDVDASEVVQSIQKRAQTASSQTCVGRPRIKKGKNNMRLTQPKIDEPSISEMYKAEGVVKKSFWESARESKNTLNSSQIRNI